jgi:hypothetical protein
LYLTGDPFFTYQPTPSIQCGRVIERKFAENLVIQNQYLPVIQPDPEPEIQLPPSPISSNQSPPHIQQKAHHPNQCQNLHQQALTQ